MKAQKQEQKQGSNQDLRLDEEKENFLNFNKFWNGNKSQSQRMTQRVNESNHIEE